MSIEEHIHGANLQYSKVLHFGSTLGMQQMMERGRERERERDVAE